MNLPQGYGDKPMGYGDNPIFLESQMRAYGRACALEAAEKVLAMWHEPWAVTEQSFINRLQQFVAELRSK